MSARLFGTSQHSRHWRRKKLHRARANALIGGLAARATRPILINLVAARTTSHLCCNSRHNRGRNLAHVELQLTPQPDPEAAHAPAGSAASSCSAIPSVRGHQALSRLSSGVMFSTAFVQHSPNPRRRARFTSCSFICLALFCFNFLLAASGSTHSSSAISSIRLCLRAAFLLFLAVRLGSELCALSRPPLGSPCPGIWKINLPLPCLFHRHGHCTRKRYV